MTRLELVQRLAREVGFQRTISTTEGTLVADVARLVGNVDQGWADIQTRRPDWQWMRSTRANGGGTSFTTVAGQHKYALAAMTGPTATTFARWLPGTFRLYTTSIGVDDEQELADRDYDNWSDLWYFGPNKNVRSRPFDIAINPSDRSSLYLGPSPDSTGFTVTGDYYRKPQVMDDDDDEPTGLPTEYHIAIVWRAMKYYARFAPAPELYQDSDKDFRRVMYELEREQLPKLASAGSL